MCNHGQHLYVYNKFDHLIIFAVIRTLIGVSQEWKDNNWLFRSTNHSHVGVVSGNDLLLLY